MENKEVGTCIHGTFFLHEGCRQCIAEAQAQARDEVAKIKSGIGGTPPTAGSTTAPSINTSPKTVFTPMPEWMPGADGVCLPSTAVPDGIPHWGLDGGSIGLSNLPEPAPTAPEQNAEDVQHWVGITTTPDFNTSPTAQPDMATLPSKELPLMNLTPPTPTTLVKVSPESDVEVQSFYTESLKMQKYAEARVIAVAEDYRLATDDLVIIRRLKKAMEERRKDYLAPFQDHIKEVNEAFKRLGEPILLADKITSDKMLAFTANQNLIRQEQEEINRLRKLASEKDAALHNGEISESVNLVEVIPEAPKTIRTDVGSASQRDHWVFEVIDFALLSDEYKMVDAVKLGKVVRAGLHSIPGVRIKNEPILATR